METVVQRRTGSKDPDELLKILEQLSKALKREEQARREFREVT
jgi:hypothetical protein